MYISLKSPCSLLENAISTLVEDLNVCVVVLFCFVCVKGLSLSANFELSIPLPQLAKSRTGLKDTYHHTQLTFLKHDHHTHTPRQNHNFKISDHLCGCGSDTIPLT